MRGGARPGAGRTPLPPDARRVRVDFNLSPLTLAELERLRLPGEPRSRAIERLVALASQRDDPADRP
ncbi:MAG TPA: hypothetical protein VN837_05555 [Chloroflexota bacterium]|nr:hypothetical protein [Chloroflexota bacterium]